MSLFWFIAIKNVFFILDYPIFSAFIWGAHRTRLTAWICRDSAHTWWPNLRAMRKHVPGYAKSDVYVRMYVRADGRTDGRTNRRMAQVGKVWCNASKNVIIYFYRNRYGEIFYPSGAAIDLPFFSSFWQIKVVFLRSSANNIQYVARARRVITLVYRTHEWQSRYR